MHDLKLYLLALALFIITDILWIGVIAKDFYREQIGFLMAPDVRWSAAILFYLIYAVGLLIFAICPALKESNGALALAYGALFGLISYATYDLTNLATLKGWPVKMVIYDVIWGAFVSAVVSWIVFFAATHWKNAFD